MIVFEAINTRYSHKEAFLPDPVPITDLEKIASAGLTAPSGNNRQTVQLIILPDRKFIDPLCEIVSHGGLATAPAAIALLTDTRINPPGHMVFDKENYSAAMQNILLAATALGYSSLWLDYPYFDEGRQHAAKKVLGIPEECRLWATIPIGKPDGPGSRRDKLPLESRLFYGNYGKH